MADYSIREELNKEMDRLCAELAAHKAALKLARDALELRAEYDPTYPPESKPVNDCAKALAAIDALQI